MNTKSTAQSTPAAEDLGRPVLVTTAHRGVFFGYLDGPEDGEILKLRRARNCLRWGREMKGFIGLAALGPDDQCRVGLAVKSMTLRNITAVLEVEAEAAKRWEAAPWRL